MIFDLPQPLGPTTPVRLVGAWKVVGSTKDLNPDILMEVSLIPDEPSFGAGPASRDDLPRTTALNFCS
jgi:hypothetical protein